MPTYTNPESTNSDFFTKKNCFYLHLQCIRINKQPQFRESLGFVDSGFVLASNELVLTPVRGTVRKTLNCLF